MATAATASSLPALAERHEREAAGRELEVVLHELVALSLVGKQLLWAVYGPLFGSVHVHIDELVGSWSELADRVAEQAVALGVMPDGQAEAVVAGSQPTPVGQTTTEDHVAVRDLTHRVARVAERARTRSYLVGEIDLVPADVLVDVVRELEKQQRMLRAQLGDRA